MNACDGAFKDLVKGALLTGARYGELARIQVQDFNPTAGTVHIVESKSGKDRQVALTEDGQAFFAGLTAGRPANELVFQRDTVDRRSRAELGNAWGSSDHIRPMKAACEAAGIVPLGIHELRHSYASLLVNKGVPLAYVAKQLGHASTVMVERHYAHLAPSALADAVRAAMPNLGFASGNVKPLKLG